MEYPVSSVTSRNKIRYMYVQMGRSGSSKMFRLIKSDFALEYLGIPHDSILCCILIGQAYF